jgi:hypothetical protein
MPAPKQAKARMAVLKEHIKAESAHDIAGVLHGFSAKCFNDIACMPKPFVGPKKVAQRYRKHWRGFPDFKVRVRRLLAMDDNCIVTENEWTGTHRVSSWGCVQPGSVSGFAHWWCGTFRLTSFWVRQFFRHGIDAETNRRTGHDAPSPQEHDLASIRRAMQNGGTQ